MNRKIKFRIWKRELQKMQYPVPPWDAQDGDLREIFFDWEDWDADKLGQDLMQFTGILDVEGREIYEGDILQVLISYEEWLTPSVVVWSKYDEAGYSLANISKIEDWKKPLIGHTVNGIELVQQYQMFNKGGYKIMGNIFQNPELLKQ